MKLDEWLHAHRRELCVAVIASVSTAGVVYWLVYRKPSPTAPPPAKSPALTAGAVGNVTKRGLRRCKKRGSKGKAVMRSLEDTRSDHELIRTPLPKKRGLKDRRRSGLHNSPSSPNNSGSDSPLLPPTSSPSVASASVEKPKDPIGGKTESPTTVEPALPAPAIPCSPSPAALDASPTVLEKLPPGIVMVTVVERTLPPPPPPAGTVEATPAPAVEQLSPTAPPAAVAEEPPKIEIVPAPPQALAEPKSDPPTPQPKSEPPPSTPTKEESPKVDPQVVKEDASQSPIPSVCPSPETPAAPSSTPCDPNCSKSLATTIPSTLTTSSSTSATSLISASPSAFSVSSGACASSSTASASLSASSLASTTPPPSSSEKGTTTSESTGDTVSSADAQTPTEVPVSPSGARVSRKELNKGRRMPRAMCDCRAARDNDDFLSDDEHLFSPDVVFTPTPTNVFPISFDRHAPKDLVAPMAAPKYTKLSKQSVERSSANAPETLLTAFRPVLNALVYAHKHAFVIKELTENYLYLE